MAEKALKFGGKGVQDRTGTSCRVWIYLHMRRPCRHLILVRISPDIGGDAENPRQRIRREIRKANPFWSSTIWMPRGMTGSCHQEASIRLRASP